MVWTPGVRVRYVPSYAASGGTAPHSLTINQAGQTRCCGSPVQKLCVSFLNKLK